MRRLAAAAAALLACAGAATLTAASGAGAAGERIFVVFDNAFGLAEGGDFKIAGVRAGKTVKFKVSHSRPRRAVVEVELTESDAPALRTDARCEIRPQSLIGEYYVDCRPGEANERLRGGSTIPVEQTSSTIPIDLVNNILRRPYRERFRLILAELGTGLAGRPQDLSEVLRRAHPGLRATNETLRIVARQERTLQRFIGDAEAVVGALEDNKSDVARWAVEAGETAEIAATRREDLARNFRRLPGFLDELDPYMARLGGLADEQVPLLRDLREGSDELDTFLARLGPFSRASRPAIRALGDASLRGTRAVRETRDEIAELRDAARSAPALAKPLRQLLETLDDRRRGVENDPRAAATDPPAPDPTHIPDGRQGGFTGMEAFWNYLFWQSMTLNGFDSTGHILRLQLVEDECAGYQVARQGNEALFDRCNQFLGPDQPGITTPDPTEIGGETASRSSRPTRNRASAPPARGAAPSAPGGEAPARGRSLPPDAVKRLVDDLTRPLGGPRPGLDPGATGQTLLDFLLGP